MIGINIKTVQYSSMHASKAFQTLLQRRLNSRRFPTAFRKLHTTASVSVAPSRIAYIKEAQNKSTIMSTISANTLFELMKNRRTYYLLNKELPISHGRVEEIVRQALQYTPSSFDTQS